MKKFILSLMGLAVAASAFAAVVTPADPTNVTWYDSGSEDGYSRLNFTLPTVDVNGNVINNENMGYRIYTDDDQIFTFERDVYSSDALYQDMTSIYYYQWSGGSDIRHNVVFFYRTNQGDNPFFTWRIGIQVFYTNDDGTGESNIVYTEVFPRLPKPLNPKVEEWVDYKPILLPEDNTYSVSSQIGFSLGTDIMGNPVADDYPGFDGDELFTGECTYTKLDPEKVTYSIYTDNDQIFVFTPERFNREEEYGLVLPATEIPFGYEGFEFLVPEVHFPQLTNNIQELLENGFDVEPFFTWRIGIQSHYTDNGQTSSSDICYMEIFPQLKPAAQVTTTSFLADWSCDAENTSIINNFYGNGCGYFLYVINKDTQDTVMVQNVAPSNTALDEWGNEYALPGATYLVEDLTPGVTYQYYVIVKQNTGASYQSVVQEVTLPTGEEVHYKPGDVNHDQTVDIDDVTAIIAKVLGNEIDICTICADINHDNAIDVDDVTATINIILGSN